MKRYIVEQQMAICMNVEKKNGKYVCRKTWTREYVNANFNSSWIKKEWRGIVTLQLLEKERRLYPESSAAVELDKKIERLKEQQADIISQIRQLQILHGDISETIYSMQAAERNGQASIYNKIKCFGIDCRGFLSDNWICGVCEKQFCKFCREIKTHDHKCNPDTVKTIKMLKKDTKPCPVCNTLIYKIDGCDQMWCTQCRTAFSWKTGAIETVIHNPHYYQWLRENKGHVPRNPGDNICDNTRLTARDTASFQNRFCNHPTNINDELSFYLTEIIRKTIHFRIHRHDFLGITGDDDVARKSAIWRKKYLTQQITEEELARLVFIENRKYNRKQEVLNIADMLIQAITDIIHRYISILKKKNNSKNRNKISQACLNEIKELIKYGNRQFAQNAKLENVNPWFIDYSTYHVIYKPTAAEEYDVNTVYLPRYRR
jgi:hypothetical protein